MKILNRKIHYFNPGHENAVWADSHYYTPPASVCKMMNDLALLPIWYAKDNDYVIMNETHQASRFLLSIPPEIRPSAIPVTPTELTLHDPAEAAPWGLSPRSIRFFETLRTQNDHILVPQWKELYKELTGRQTALLCLSKICSSMHDEFAAITLPRFCTTSEEIRQFITAHPPPYILKAPYSCSGRGLYRIGTRDLDLQASRWIAGTIKKQGIISIERALDKVCDFAMEFEATGDGQIRFEGLALFNTSSKGTYSSNLLASQATIERHLSTFISTAQLLKVRETVTSVLAELFGFDYRGYLGVDMLIYRKENGFALHPCIEINVRYTMGLVALQLNKIVHSSAQGQLVIDCHTAENSAYSEHLRMNDKYPLQLFDSCIRSGYLSLCPVQPDTHYRAYLLIENN